MINKVQELDPPIKKYYYFFKVKTPRTLLYVNKIALKGSI